MVISHNNVTMERIVGSLIYHDVIPIVIIKKENSLICPKDIPARKLFFLVCQRNHNTTMVMIGFTISTNPAKINNGTNVDIVVVQKLTCDQSSTKKITIKKSLSGLILLVISNLYDEFAKVIHATNVPISIPNHNR